ncbi:hypothetical protein [Curtobacterium sp. MCBD17_032]|uniref:hypothetical protein n=1 Tax=Curtobacterium sp. MCBD17_032 TaxID=2175659 RepID=UPI001C64FF19|nr:hypothetical protein [Curtobacterium sp. MCBD17_032]
MNHDAATRPRRQDRDPEYRETGAFYAMRVDGFRAARHRFFGRVELAVVPARTAIDIDDVHDLDLAAALAPLVEPAAGQDATEPTTVAPHSVPAEHALAEHAPTEHDPTDPHPAGAPAAENGAP